jgi:uncharacterized membrane protein (UPF0127 family)
MAAGLTKRLVLFWLLLLPAGSAIAVMDFERIVVDLDGRDYRLEIADTPARRSQGLMFRDRLPGGSGMLFVYPRSGDYRIWMKNTRIPLTVLWLDADARILHRALLRPCRRDPCPVESSPAPARYILELPAADFDRFPPGKRLPGLLSPPPGRGAATAPPAGSRRSGATPSG